MCATYHPQSTPWLPSLKYYNKEIHIVAEVYYVPTQYICKGILRILLSIISGNGPRNYYELEIIV